MEMENREQRANHTATVMTVLVFVLVFVFVFMVVRGGFCHDVRPPVRVRSSPYVVEV
jgi:ABC-type transporter Mla subunit MlaD